ncbi:MAG: putative quinol monooxygenase [Propionibacteriaceae bacterium]|nr:putative quinol monooxygenase [Propionibacteriaceae bacterium]
MSMVACTVFVAAPGNEAVVIRLIRQLAVKVRRDPGNVAFEVSQLDENPRKFMVYESYADPASLKAHTTAPYRTVFNAALTELIEPGSYHVALFTPLSR